MMKSICTALLLLVCATYASCIQAQECPEGIPSAGNPDCLPPDDANSPYYQGDRNGQTAQPAQPPVVWASRYGAVAYDSVSGAEGHITDQSSKSQAESTVLSFCSQHGGTNCKVLVSYYNQCAAIAQVSGGGQMGTGRALHPQQAEQLAMDACQKGASNCKIVYSACSLPVRVQ
jgi:hypothetical protein